MAVNLSLLGGAGWQFFDNNGVPLAGGLLYTYQAGTAISNATYTSSSGLIPNANPIVLSSTGRVPFEIWLTQGVSYKFVLKTSAFITIGTYDNIDGAADPADIYAALAASSGSSLVGFIQSGSGAVATTVQAKLRESVSVLDFGATGDGTTDDTTAIQAALNASRYVVVPIGTYRLESTITVPANTRLEFQGGTSIVSPPPAVFFKAHNGVGISLGASCIISGGGIYSNKTTYPTGNGINMLGGQSTIENFAINDVGGVGIRLGSVSTYVNTNSCQLTNIKIYGCGSDGIYIHDAFGSDSNAHTITSCVVIACNGHGIRLNRTFWATVINCNVEICTGYGLYLSGETVPNDPDCRYANIFGGDYNEGNTAGPIFDNSYFPFIQIADVNAKPTNARSGAGSILQFLGGTQNELYGLTSTSGIISTAVHTKNLTNIALATGVATTIMDVTVGGYLVTAYLNGYGNDSCASALVVYSGTGDIFVSANNSTYLTITGTSTLVKLTQTKTANATGVYTFLKLGQI